MTIADAVSAVRERIARAAERAGRNPSSVKLVAVSKTKSLEAIREAYAAGQRAFGENYAQELDEKVRVLSDLREIEWHFIGHLQTNKAKVVARCANVVQTVHSPEVAAELGKRAAAAGRTPFPVLVEVKLSDEATKHGVTEAALGGLLDAIDSDPRLRLRGLMTMAPAVDPTATKRVFDELVALRARHGGASRLPELSMGMTDDFEMAIACGATLVRIGAAVFGPR
jgi:pyridoxal phosphate enzyme (YggS family)